MVTLVLIYGIISGFAGLRGYKSPLFGAAGIILYIIFQFPAASMMPKSSEYVQCIVAAVVAVAFLSFVVLLLPSRDVRAEPKQSAVPYAVIGVVSLLFSCGVAGLWFFAITRGGGSQTPFLLGAALLLTGALACFHLHKQQELPSASEALKSDSRPPVLFLRSFQSDAARVKPWGSGMLPMFPDWLGKSFEEFLAPAMHKGGPFIALGNPEDYLPTLGALKVYRRDDNWPEAVLDFLRRAKLVILLEGNTPGLSWELGQVRQHCSPRSVFLVTPTKKFSRTGWRDFANLLKEAKFEVPSEDVGPGAVVGFDDSFQPVVLGQKVTTAQEYAKAINDWQVVPKEESKSIPAAALNPTRAFRRPTNQEPTVSSGEAFGFKLLGWLLGVFAFLAALYFLNRR